MGLVVGFSVPLVIVLVLEPSPLGIVFVLGFLVPLTSAPLTSVALDFAVVSTFGGRPFFFAVE